MINKVITIWGREFELPVEYMCYDDECITTIQQDAVKRFFEKANDLLVEQKEIKAFCLQHNASEIPEESISNIFRYVKPIGIFVPQSKKERVIAILCDYRFDIEHGIAIVFENEKFLKIVTQDKII